MEAHDTIKERKNYGVVEQPLAAASEPRANLKVETFCKVYGVSPSTAWRLIRDRKVDTVRMGKRCTRITSDSAAKWGRGS